MEHISSYSNYSFSNIGAISYNETTKTIEWRTRIQINFLIIPLALTGASHSSKQAPKH
jgi:hypothetical protein